MRLTFRALVAAFALWGAVSASAGDHSAEVQVEQSAVTITSTTTGTARLCAAYAEALYFVSVTATSGSPTLDVTIEVAPTADGPWATHTTMTQMTSTGVAVAKLTNFGKWIRIKDTVGGDSPSLTLSSYFVFKN